MTSKIALILSTSFLLSVFWTEVASAQQTRHAQLKNIGADRCVKTPTAPHARETPVTIGTCSGSPNDYQTVKFVQTNRERWSIRTADGKACLNLKSSSENRNGGRVKWVGCSSHPDQLWILTGKQTPNGMQTEIRNVSSNKCLFVHGHNENHDGGLVTVYSCGKAPSQRWAWESTASAIGLDDLKIASHNVWFMTMGGPFGLAGQKPLPMSQRARDIAADGYLKGQDIVVLNELFDDAISNELMRALRLEYPYQTDVAGRTSKGSELNWDKTWGNNRKVTRLESGVAVLSKWPIERKEQYLFSAHDLCGWDKAANKGFVYARVRYRNSQKLHIIATHLQSEEPLACKDANTVGATGGHSKRSRELERIREFLDDKNIPASEAVFVVGDLNINFGTREAEQMLKTLKANKPVFTGNRGSYDGSPDENGQYNPFVGNNLYPQILDYILTLRDHAAPTNWYTEIRRKNGMSDHYPVFGSSQKTGSFIQPDLSEYRITIHTAHGRGAGTDSNIVAIINGRSGKSRRVKLNSRIYHNAFEIGSSETVKVEAENLVDPKSITLEFDDAFPGSDWRIRKIEVLKVGSRIPVVWNGNYEFSSKQNKTFPLR